MVMTQETTFSKEEWILSMRLTGRYGSSYTCELWSGNDMQVC